MDVAELVLAVREGWISEDEAREHWQRGFLLQKDFLVLQERQLHPVMVLEGPGSSLEGTNACSPARDMGESGEGL